MEIRAPVNCTIKGKALVLWETRGGEILREKISIKHPDHRWVWWLTPILSMQMKDLGMCGIPVWRPMEVVGYGHTLVGKQQMMALLRRILYCMAATGANEWSSGNQISPRRLDRQWRDSSFSSRPYSLGVHIKVSGEASGEGPWSFSLWSSSGSWQV